MSWVKAVWIEGEKEVEGTVPDLWLGDKCVLWPPVANSKPWIKERRKPTDKWRKFHLIKIKLRSENYEECDIFDDTTTVECSEDEEDMGRRHIKKKSFGQDFVSADDPSNQPKSPVGVKTSKERGKKSVTPKLPAQPLKIVPTDNRNQSARSPYQQISRQSSKSRSLTYSPRGPIRSRSRSLSSGKGSSERSRSSLFRNGSQRNNTPRSRSSRSRSRRSRSSRSRSRRSRSSRSRSPISRNRSCKYREFSRSHSRSRSSSVKKGSQKQSYRKSRSSSRSSLDERYQRSHSLRGHDRSRSRSSSCRRTFHRSIRLSTDSVRSSTMQKRSCTHEKSRSPSLERSLTGSGIARRRLSSSSAQKFGQVQRKSRSPLPSLHNTSSTRRNRSRSQSRSEIRSRPLSQALASKSKKASDPGNGLYPMTEEKFQKRVLYLLSDIRHEIAELKKSRSLAECTDSQLDLNPVTNLDEFSALEATLKDPSKRHQMVQNLSKIGGLNVKEGVKMILNRIMTNEVMSSMNLKGNRGKMAFESTSICQTVIASAVKRFDVTEHMVREAVGRCLKYAPDRRGGAGRSKVQD